MSKHPMKHPRKLSLEEANECREAARHRRHAWYSWYLLLDREQRKEHYKASNHNCIDRRINYSGELLQYIISEGTWPSASTQSAQQREDSMSPAEYVRKSANSEK